MQFSISAVVLAFASMATALPTEASNNGLQSQEPGHVRWPVPGGMSVKEAQSKCGDQAQLSCCNVATYAGDTTDVNAGIGGGLLSNLIGSGSGAKGAGIFDQCSKLDVQIPILIAVPIQDVLNQRCKQNVACCANSPSTASNDLVGAGLPCVALGSIL
ncbi:fungal hydrophobin [Penicillium angulare]|uniref:fungal hydrophobin n=1 Tax=Penicillium angulare TaxID=116970 RepID=UPI002541D37A|nr:fungal hydrophobin [Penicillium angulare]KAJ5287257.1 fungal hydrophobin [Penicillium angulare]